jgi:carbon-monoxide dehydrogenase medium subunit
MPIDAGHAVEEFARRHGDFAIVAIAAAIRIDGEACRWARLAAAGTGPAPVRLRAAENILIGGGLGASAIEEAANVAAAELVDLNSDNNGSADYRRHLTKVLTGRAIQRAISSLP